MRAHPPTGALPVIRKLRIYYSSHPRPPLRLLCAVANRPFRELLPLLRYCRPSSRRGFPVRELFRLLWVGTTMGHPATFQMMGKKATRERERERGGTSEIDHSRYLATGEIHNIPPKLSRKHAAITAGEEFGMRGNKSVVFPTWRGSADPKRESSGSR